MKQCVCGVRTGDAQALASKRFNGRLDDIAIFGSECPVLAGMRIEAGDRETRMRNSEVALQSPGHDTRGLDDLGRRQQGRDILQRNVNRHRHDAQLG